MHGKIFKNPLHCMGKSSRPVTLHGKSSRTRYTAWENLQEPVTLHGKIFKNPLHCMGKSSRTRYTACENLQEPVTLHVKIFKNLIYRILTITDDLRNELKLNLSLVRWIHCIVVSFLTM